MIAFPALNAHTACMLSCEQHLCLPLHAFDVTAYDISTLCLCAAIQLQLL